MRCWPLLNSALFFLVAELAHAQTATPFSPKDIIAEVRARAPEISVARAEAEAARARIPQAGALDDPRVAVMPNFINPTIKGQGEIELWVKQALPARGERALRVKVAEKEAAATALSIEESQRTSELMAWSALAKIAAIDREVDILAHHLSFAEAVTQAAEASYASRKAPLSEVLAAKMLHTELERRKLQLQGARAVEVATLNFLMDLPSSTPLEAAPTLSVLPVESSLESLIAQATTARPTLQAAQLRSEGAEAQLALAKRERRPDYDLGLALMPQLDGTFQVGAFVEVMVPLYAKNKQDKAIDEAKALSTAQKARADLEAANIASEVTQAYALLQAAQRQQELIESRLVPDAKATSDATLTAYQAGQAPLSAVLQAEVELLHLEIMLQDLRSEALTARAALEAAVGGALK